MKPSDRIAEIQNTRCEIAIAALREGVRRETGLEWSDTEWDEFANSLQGKAAAEQLGVNALVQSLVIYLDEEAERRAKFESEVLERLAKLEEKPGNESIAALASRTNNLNERLTKLEMSQDAQSTERLERLERET